jgi:hypothetical protein
MKGIVVELMEMRIPLKPVAKPVKHRPYRLNPRYKEKVKEEIDHMLKEGIIEPIEESEWISLMVVEEKKTWGIRICIDLRKLNDECLYDPFPILSRPGEGEIDNPIYFSIRKLSKAEKKYTTTECEELAMVYAL